MSPAAIPADAGFVGYCGCGCGQVTPLADRTRASEGKRKGYPMRFILGHNSRRTPNDYEVTADGCWIWQRSILKRWGYGIAWRDGKHGLAHRWYYEQAKGPIPAGLHLDHLCRNRACVNPEHLEAVTRRTNVRRGINAKLTETTARQIRVDWTASGMAMRPYAQLVAPQYSVSSHCIYDLLRGRTWNDESVPT